LLFSLLISLSFSGDSSCSEQWTEIALERNLWTRIGDVNEDQDTERPLVFEFGQKDSSSTDIGGAVWHPYDFSKKRGILISFKPTIKYDESYFGNVKYPQGFAIVFTSSSIENLIGEKGPGLGYEGIMNAIAFEFDFVKQSNYGDSKKPHFSVNFNISGEISASTKDRTDSAINRLLPNFYDNSLDGYLKNIIFEIEIIGKKLKVRSKREGYEDILTTDFVEFQKLLEQEDVHIGITASMNQNKKVIIEDFKVSEISTKEKGDLEIKGSEAIPVVKAGEEVTLFYSIKSTCDEKLKIFSNEYSGSDLKLLINNEEVKPETIIFDEESVQLKMIVTQTKENIYTALVDFQGKTSVPSKFIVTSSDINRLELCDVDEEKEYHLTSEPEQTKDNFYVPLCFYDQYGNRKPPTSTGMSGIKVGFPDNLMPNNIVETSIDDINKRLEVKVPFNTFGEYKIFSEDFIESKLRYINIMPKIISPKKSELSILYDQNVIQSDDSVVSLRIKPKDNYGRDIPNIILEKMNCSFGSSMISTQDNTKIEITEEYKNDYILLTPKNKIEKSGRYIFTPKVECNGIEPTILDCGINLETKLNNCEFYKLMPQISTNHISVLDEYLKEYTIYESGENNNYLYISLDEGDNKKLTEIMLLDGSNSPYLKIPTKTLNAKLDGVKLEVTQLGNKYVLILPKEKSRNDYSPLKSYDLEISFDSSSFTIKTKFYYLDQYITNLDNTKIQGSTIISHKAFYKQNSLTLEASNTLLLFDIYEQIESGYLHLGNNLDKNKVSITINGQLSGDIEIVNQIAYLSVFIHKLTKANKYTIILKYDTETLAEINLEIIPKKEAYYLAYNNGTLLNYSKNIPIGKEEHIKLIMLDKYENAIETNEIFNAFSKIKISQFDIFDIRLDYSGKIHINNYGKTGKSVNLTLVNGKTYTFESIYSPKSIDISPLNSYGSLINSPIITVDESVQVRLFLRDKYGNEIKTKEKFDTAVNIYIGGVNSKLIIPMTLEPSATYEYKFKNKTALEKNGDYEITIFINNFPVECQACHFRKNLGLLAEAEKATIYILGNKQKIPVTNSRGKTNYNVGLVDKNWGYFSFYLEERDQYNNEYKETKSLTFSFEADNKTTDVTSISICPFGNNEDERNYFKLCTGVIDAWKKLPNGIYRIMTLSDTLIFTLYITDSFIDSSDTTPVMNYSSILLNTNEIYGKTDMPGSFILDLRNKNYKRIENIDITNITINEGSNSLNYEITHGPEKGLLTVFLLASKPGQYKFNVLYNNKTIIDKSYTYHCDCGFEKKLKYINNGNLENGNYAFFQVLDSKNNQCNSQYYWNDFPIKEYANNLFSARDSANGNIYKIDTYYNILSNTFIFYFDNHVPDSLTISSKIIKFGENQETQKVSLASNILDENHFSVKYDSNKLTVTPLDANYEKANNYKLDTSDFDVALIRIINDDFKIIKNDFNVSSLEIKIDDTIIDAKGKYIYIVYYKGKELFCQNCIIDKTENRIDITKTKVYKKEGDDNYIQSNQNLIMPMIKNNMPFFRINLYSNNDNLIIPESTSDLTIQIKAQDTIISNQVKLNSNGNIYIYLTKEGRDAYLKLEPMTLITLTIKYSENNYAVSYYVFDYHKKKQNSKEYCSTGAVPLIINKQETYIKRQDEQLELEIYLSECDEENNEIKNSLKIFNKKTGDSYDAEIIPTDIIGGYILFLPTKISVSEANQYYIVNNKAKSDLFELSVIPDYDVKQVSFSKDNDMDETETDKLYTYFLVQLKDSHENIITNVGRNLFANDLNVLRLDKNLPYKLTYDQSKKVFRCQVPINGYGEITAQTVESIGQQASLKIEIGSPKFILNSVFKLESENSNNFTFSMELIDEYYKIIKSKSYYYKISFNYFTINPLTREVFVTKVDHQEESGKYTINLKSSFPKYSIYGFIPYIGFLPQICPDCVKINENPEYIYSIEKENYIPHNLEKNLFLIKNDDLPVYLYLAHKLTSIQVTNANSKEIISNEKTKLYLISYNNNTGSAQMEVKFNDKIFSVRFIDYSPQAEIEIKSIPPYIENYGYKVYSKNNLDFIHIGFFMENRDNNGKLITTQPNLVIDNDYAGIIKRINVINTCYYGIYYVKVTFSKSAKIEFYPKFNKNHKDDVNYTTILLKAIAAFPTDIVLNNKEIINKNVVKYNLVTSNSFSENTCDDRLNIFVEDINLKKFKKKLVQEREDCFLYIKFTGETVIKSNINNFKSDINNNGRSLYNINPSFSSLRINPNVFDNTEETLSIEFQERTPSGVSYQEKEVNDNKNLYIYKYITPNKMKLIKTYSGLFSSIYLFNPAQLKLERGSTYILIGDVVYNNIPPSFVYYKQKASSNTNEIKSIQATYYNEEKKSNIISNFGDSKSTGDSFELNLPLLLKIKLLDSSGNPVDIEYNNENQLRAKLLLPKGNDIDLTLLHYNDDTFYIKPDIKTTSYLLHLPIYIIQDYYYIQISYNETYFYSLLSLKKTDLQYSAFKRKYDYPNNGNILNSFSAKIHEDDDTLYINKDTPLIYHICLLKKENANTLNVNQHLDTSKLELSISTGCTFKYANSYMGCFAFSTTECVSGELSIKYNGVGASNTLSIHNFASDDIVMAFNKEKSQSIKESNQTSVDLVFNQETRIENSDLFKVFINGDLLEKTDYSLIYNLNDKQIKFSLGSSKLTSISRIKNVTVTYEEGNSIQRKLISEDFQITINQEKYDTSSEISNKYQLQIQEPFDIMVGDLIYFYILLYDPNNACFYGDFDILKNMKINLKIGESSYVTQIKSQEKVKGYSQCEYIYRVEFEQTSKISGNFDVEAIDNELKGKSKLYIAPKGIDEEKSSFSGNTTVQAGQNFYVIFSGTDSEGNKINYYDLIREFDIQLNDSSYNLVDKGGENFTYNIRVNKDNTAFNILMKIKNRDTYTLEALYKGKKMNLKDSFKINVLFGQCSTTDANPTILKIDQRNETYIGETVTVEILCKDILGNAVEKEGNEIFTANIKQIVDNETEIEYDYKKGFSNGKHLISFTPSKIGFYSIDISLNGKKYGNNSIVEVIPINKTKYSCMNKKQFDDLVDCDDEEHKYRDFIRNILTDQFMCYNNTTPGQIYKCLSEDEQCVSNTTNCGCLGESDKWNGYCYSKKSNPIELVKNNTNKVTCLNKIKAKNPLATVYQCEDGTCRTKAEECFTTFECPLGYRSCGNKCILLSETCSMENTCSSDEVLCWDLSCAKNYDLCPTRITCPKGKVLCPDGSCQLTGHCLQPLIRSCPNNQYQCPDFSCVASQDDCKKNPVCDVGLSLCENSLCKESCQEIIEPEDKFRCPNGKYVDNTKLCPSDIFVPQGYIKCPNGGIALDNKDCQYVQGGIPITCPNSKPILCPDLSCVEKSSNCSTVYIPKCPPHKPYQCWNNECRKSFDECPTPVTCPVDSPVLCQTGFCAKSSDECGEKNRR
jgi:hypothetical protein